MLHPFNRNICSIILYLISVFVVSNAIVIKTKQGYLEGFVLKSRNGTSYFAFLGIPYAKPPVGDLRLEPPQPPDSWTNVRNATKPPPVCVQKEFLFRAGKEPIGQEDCLYLNVYAPSKVNKKSGLPVMVWIHGGALIEGSGYFYSPDYFLDHEVVVVTINYRLGALGFLSAADEVLPGNYGMKDQAAALRWVQQYINDFGGNPQQVTIFGESAGGACVHSHFYSPLSKGLFHRAISQSGTSMAVWAQLPSSLARQRFIAFAILAGCSIKSTKVIVDCLKTIPAHEFSLTEEKFHVWDIIPILSFSIVMEPASVVDAFLIQDTWKKTNPLNKVPWIVGFNSAEGAMQAARFLSNDEKLAIELNANYKRLLPLLFIYGQLLKPKETDQITEALKQFYFGDKKIGIETAHELVKLMSDGYFAYDSIVTSKRHTEETYVYYYDHKGDKSFQKIFGNISLDLGISHADDLLSFFPLLGPQSESDSTVSKRMVKYWVNFASTGYLVRMANSDNRGRMIKCEFTVRKPTVDSSWRATKSKETDYLHIQTEADTLETGLLQERYLFWKNIKAHLLDIEGVSGN